MNHRYFRNHRDVRENPYTPNTEAQEVAAEYCEIMGFPPPQPFPYTEPSAATEKELAVIFENTPDQSDEERVRSAYAEMLKQIKVQWSILPVKIEAFGDDFVPYKDSPAMMDDVIKNHHLWVYDGGADHTLMTRKENFQFRACHDFFGHCQKGFAFGPKGEFNAFQEHCEMFSPRARRALACETRAQQAWVVRGPYGHLPITERPYAEQKSIWIPDKFCTTPQLQKAYADYPDFFPPVTESNPRRRSR